MSREYLADKPTLDEVNEKIGDAGGSSIFAKLNSIISAIADYVAIWTAAKAGNLDTTVSSRAPASTALSTAQWTNTRAGYLDKLNSGVVVSSLTGKIIKSIQKGVATTAQHSTDELNVTITSVDVNKSVVIVTSGQTGGYDYYGGTAYLKNSTTLTVKNTQAYGNIQFRWQVIEFY